MSNGEFFDDEPEIREFTVELTDSLCSDVDQTWQNEGYTSRDEFVRHALRDAVRESEADSGGWGHTGDRSTDRADQHSDEQKAAEQLRLFLLLLIVMIIIGYTLFTRTNPLLGVSAAAVVYWIFRKGGSHRSARGR